MVDKKKIEARMRQNLGVVGRAGQQKTPEHPLSVPEFVFEKIVTSHRHSPIVVEMHGIVDEDARSQYLLWTPTYEPGEERTGIQAAIGNVRPIGAP